MDELGGYRELAPMQRAVGSAVFVALLGLTGVLERFQFTLRDTEATTWWASNGRDVVNLFALAAMAIGLKVIGFAGPISLCIAATIVLLLSALQSALAEHPHVWLWCLGAALALGAPVLIAPRFVHAVFRGSIEWLFPA